MSGEGEPDGAKRVLTHKQAVELALNDPVARAQVARDPLVRRRTLVYAQHAEGMLADLAAAGFPGLAEVGELRRRGLNYKAAVPVLIEWLPRVSYLNLAEAIVRTLSVPFARKLARPVFLKLFRDPPEVFAVENPMLPQASVPAKEALRSTIGIGLGLFADPSVADELIEFALDRTLGEARVAIVDSLPKTKDERVPEVLLSLLDDPSVRASAVAALGRLRYTPARAPIEPMLGDPDKNVRDQAKKALKRIDDAQNPMPRR